MPLHLLGKKSWNVYNADNIARVRRDEAEARAREEAAEQRMQAADAARRLAILRGETPPPLPTADDDDDDNDARDRAREGEQGKETRAHDSFGGLGRKRKRAGEDDTDFEMRIAREQAGLAADSAATAATAAKRRRRDDADPAPPPPEGLVDQAGHIALFAEPLQSRATAVPAASSTGTGAGTRRPRKSDRAVDRDEPDPVKEAEKMFKVRLTDAAGRDGAGLTDGGPWYAKKDAAGAATATATGRPDADLVMTAQKDAWGKEDLGRRGREAGRMSAGDPLMMMKMGAASVRSLETERKRDEEERNQELVALRKEERRRDKERRRERRREGERGRNRDRREAKDDRVGRDGAVLNVENIELDRRGRSERRRDSYDDHKESRRGSEHRRDRRDAEHRRDPDRYRHPRSHRHDEHDRH